MAILSRFKIVTPTTTLALICAFAGFAYFSQLYREAEFRFSFYQTYLHSAVNLYCLGDPDVRNYNQSIPIKNERIDLAQVSCEKLSGSEKIPLIYWNGWHDLHPLFSTLVSLCWRWLGLDWKSLWPIAGGIGGATILSLYVILRGFGLPWYAAAVLLPSSIFFSFIGEHFYYLRDFSKVPFILLSFGLLGLLFDNRRTAGTRAVAIAASSFIAAAGIGFRQDTVVILPVILAAVILTSSLSLAGSWRLIRELTVVLITTAAVITLLGLIKTTQVRQLEGYPHFLVQGFADSFWQHAQMRLAGLSFLSFYSDALAWAFVDGNSPLTVDYFANFDPNYTASGIDLIAHYSEIAAPDIILRVFWAWSSLSHMYGIMKPVGAWLLLFALLVVLGRWRLGLFLALSCVSLIAAGSLQFDIRHSVHFVLMDRVILIIAATASLSALWDFVMQRTKLYLWQAVAMLGIGTVSVCVMLTIAAGIQRNKLDALTKSYESLQWTPYSASPPALPDLMLRATIAPDRCISGRIAATVEAEGKTATYSLPTLDGTPRSIYFAVYNQAGGKPYIDMAASIKPSQCVVELAWTSISHAPVVPLQFFDPGAAKANSAARHFWREFANSLF